MKKKLDKDKQYVQLLHGKFEIFQNGHLIKSHYGYYTKDDDNNIKKIVVFWLDEEHGKDVIDVFDSIPDTHELYCHWGTEITINSHDVIIIEDLDASSFIEDVGF